MSIGPIEAIIAGGALNPSTHVASGSVQPQGSDFSSLLLNGLDAASDRISQADAAVRHFILDDSIPVHQVTYALAQAQLSLELVTQVRGRLVEGFQQIMNMQI